MDKLRIVYEQTGAARWMSHLDTMRTLQRVMNRAGVPIRYSEGFNPHALLSILMPLSVGTESLCQMADIRLRADVDPASLPERLTAVMPRGLRAVDCYEDGAKPALAKWLRAEGIWEYDSRDTREAAQRLEAFFAGEVTVIRRTKRGEGPFTLSPHVRELRFIPEEGLVRVECLVSCNEPVVNPDLLTAAVAQGLPDWTPDGAGFCRTALYTADGGAFR